MENCVFAYRCNDFLSTGKMLKNIGFQQLVWKEIVSYTFPQFIFTHSTAPVQNYKQELMFAVISRTLFWMVTSPAFRDASTFLIACMTVV